jgi:hypothetical protein
MLAIYGPGKLSLDYLLGRQALRAGNDVRPASVTI